MSVVSPVRLSYLFRLAWFGPKWDARICGDEEDEVPVPVGLNCRLCGEKVKEGERGLLFAAYDDGDDLIENAVHIFCWLSYFGAQP